MTAEERQLMASLYRQMAETLAPDVTKEVSHADAQTVFHSEECSHEAHAVSGMQQAIDLVRQFHQKLDIHPVARLCQMDESLSETLDFVSACLSTCAERLIAVSHDGDARLAPAGKLVEEVGELIGALRDLDETRALDGLADATYILNGMARTFDLPLPEAFVEVHKSNMTKERQPDDADGHIVRDKGPNFVPPDLAAVLRAYRRRQFGSHSVDGQECRNCGMSVKEILTQIDETGRAACKGARL